jgi:hypothetical protein
MANHPNRSKRNRIRLDDHPWAGNIGSLIAYEKYGLGWFGWRVKLDSGQECYANKPYLKWV